MTLRGILITLLELFFVVLAFGTEFKQFAVMAICVGGLMLYAIVSLIFALLTVMVDSSIDKANVLRGGKVKYKLTVFGMAILPMAVYLSVNTTEIKRRKRRKSRHSFILVPSFSLERSFAFELPCNHIGMWDVGINKIRFEDIFGLFSIPVFGLAKSRFVVKLAVMPNVHELVTADEKIKSGGFGSSGMVNSEEGELLGDSRLYKDGDSLKRINWKLSARTKTLYSRQYEVPQKPKVAVVLDLGVLSEPTGDLIDIACETAVSLAGYFIENNNPIEIITVRNKVNNENTVYSLSNFKEISRMQYNLAGAGFFVADKPLTLDEIDNANFLNADKVYFISSNPSAQLLCDLEEINKNKKSAVCIVPRAVSLNDFFEQSIVTKENLKIDITSTDLIKERIGEVL